MSLPPGNGGSSLELWTVDLAKWSGALLEIERREPRLSLIELRQAERYASDGEALEYLAAHVALRSLLERSVGTRVRQTPFLRGANGKPHIAGEIRFNLSRTRNFAAMAICRGRDVGIDVERSRPFPLSRSELKRLKEFLPPPLSVRSCGEQQNQAGSSTDDLRDWTLIEAWLKANGQRLADLIAAGNLGADLVTSIGPCIRAGMGIARDWNEEAWTAIELATPFGYCGTCCVKGDPGGFDQRVFAPERP